MAHPTEGTWDGAEYTHRLRSVMYVKLQTQDKWTGTCTHACAHAHRKRSVRTSTCCVLVFLEMSFFLYPPLNYLTFSQQTIKEIILKHPPFLNE